MVGAPGFEPGASCAQGRRNAPTKSCRYNTSPITSFRISQVRMWADVPGCSRLVVGSLQKPLQAILTRLNRAPQPYEGRGGLQKDPMWIPELIKGMGNNAEATCRGT